MLLIFFTTKPVVGLQGHRGRQVPDQRGQQCGGRPGSLQAGPTLAGEKGRGGQGPRVSVLLHLRHQAARMLTYGPTYKDCVCVCVYSYSLCILFASRFVPYIGIVTILMNDYPKFKVGCCCPLGGLLTLVSHGSILL